MGRHILDGMAIANEVVGDAKKKICYCLRWILRSHVSQKIHWINWDKVCYSKIIVF